MNDARILDYLRSRGHAEPPAAFVASVMAAVDAAPPRRSWFSAYLPAVAVAAVVTVVGVLALLLGPARDVGPAPSGSGTPSAAASSTSRVDIDYRQYVEDVLVALEAYHWDAPNIDWQAARAAALDGLPEHPGADQAHARIRTAIQTFDFFNTNLVRPEDVPPAGEGAGEGEVRLPTAERLGNAGYLGLPPLAASGDAALREYLRAARLEMETVEGSTPACGWVVDLRDYDGGAWGPPILALGGLLGEGRAITFTSNGREWWLEVDADGGVTAGGDPSTDAADSPYIESAGGVDSGEVVDEPLPAEPPHVPSVTDAPVAVLVSNATVRGGEQTLVAFLGRPSTRVFGGQTGGLPIVAPNHQLSDGAVLRIPTWVPVDRDGQRYSATIIPDEVLADTRGLGSDAILDAALTWLSSTASCSGG